MFVCHCYYPIYSVCPQPCILVVLPKGHSYSCIIFYFLIILHVSIGVSILASIALCMVHE